MEFYCEFISSPDNSMHVFCDGSSDIQAGAGNVIKFDKNHPYFIAESKELPPSS